MKKKRSNSTDRINRMKRGAAALCIGLAVMGTASLRTAGAAADTETVGQSGLVINEAVSWNGSYMEQGGEYYDWVELKNRSEKPIRLQDYYLSDKKKNLQKFRLPDGTLEPGEMTVIFCSGDSSLGTDALPHANSAVGADEWLYLTDQDGTVCDRLHVQGVPLYGSIGRMDGSDDAWYFVTPTPNEENRDGYREISAPPEASVAQGVYNGTGPFEVELSGEGEIRYTLDGSVPDASDTKYTGPITISETTVLRAVCMEKGKLASVPATFSYIVNENDSLPVTSLVCEPEEMFSWRGVYMADRALDARCDAEVSFFDTNGDGFTAGCSVELHGARSRTVYKKKSFELKFASRYGGDVQYDLFGDGQVTEFHSLLLRGGSSVDLDTVHDDLAAKLMGDVYPELYPQNARHTAVYINGEYYGIYSWREAYSGEYFESHTGADADGVVIERGPVRDGELWELIRFIGNHPILSDEEYREVAERLDLKSVAAWLAAEAFFDNQDINGNIRYVRLTEGAKWQVILYDLDYTCTKETAGWNTAVSSYQLGNVVCRVLLQRPEFREILLETSAELYRNGLTTEHALKILEELLSELDEDTVRKDCERWNEDDSAWQRSVESLKRNLGDARMKSWLEGVRTQTMASDEEMRRYFPAG